MSEAPKFDPIESMSTLNVKLELDSIMSDPKSPYNDPLHPSHSIYAARVRQAHDRLYPESPYRAALVSHDQTLHDTLVKAGIGWKEIEESKQAQEDFVADSIREKAEKALREELGVGYEESVALAEKAFSSLSREQIAEAHRLGLSNNPRFIRAMADVARAIMEAEGGNEKALLKNDPIIAGLAKAQREFEKG